jgi:hypothetical protein
VYVKGRAFFGFFFFFFFPGRSSAFVQNVLHTKLEGINGYLDVTVGQFFFQGDSKRYKADFACMIMSIKQIFSRFQTLRLQFSCNRTGKDAKKRKEQNKKGTGLRSGNDG